MAPMVSKTPSLTVPVGHLRTPYLALSETFIYSTLTNLGPPFVPIVFTKEIINREVFPLGRVVNISLPRKSLIRLLNGVANKLFGYNHILFTYFFRRHRLRLLHAHFGPRGWEVLKTKRKMNLPLITNFYGYDISLLPREKEWQDRYHELFKEGELFLVEGSHMKRCLEELGCPPQKIRIQHISVDVNRIPYRERIPKEGAPVVFLFCGRFIEKKGLIYALQAFREVLNEGLQNFEFQVIGDGPLMPEVREFIQKNKMESNVKLLGFKSQAEFWSALDRADIFVAPSVTASNGDTEGGAPTTILEAQAAGLPILATRHADIPEVTVDQKSALLAPERDIQSLKDNILFFLRHPEIWTEFGRAGRRHVESFYNVRTEIKKLEALYNELLESSAR